MNHQAARQLALAAVAYVAAQRALDAHLAARPPKGEGPAYDAAWAAWWRQDRPLYRAALAAYDRLAGLADSWRLTGG